MTVRSGTPVSYRDLHPLAESLFARFVGELVEKLDDRAETCRDTIASLYGVPSDAAARYAAVQPPISLGHHASISDFVNVCSHVHDIHDTRPVSLQKTVIADHARLTSHATVPAGARMGRDGMVGAMALATRPAPGMQVSVGIPARPFRLQARPCPSCEAETRATAESGRPGA